MTVIIYISPKGIWNTFGFIVFGKANEINRHFKKILGTIQKTFVLLIFGNLIQRDDIPQTGSSDWCQLITRVIIVLFYRHNKNRQSFCNQPYWLQNKIATWYTLQTWMVLARRQTQILINQFNNISINQQVNMAAPVNYVISPFEGNINHGYSIGIRLYLQYTKDIDKESDKLDIPV